MTSALHPNLHQQFPRLAHDVTTQNQNKNALDNAVRICVIYIWYQQYHCKAYSLSNLSNLRTFWMCACRTGSFGI